MKNITLSADEQVIEKARRIAVSNHTTLNEQFRKWLDQYVKKGGSSGSYTDFMERNSAINAGKSFTREELNER